MLLRALTLLVVTSFAPTVALAIPDIDRQSCAGDCSGDNKVGVNELVTGTAISLGNRATDACPSLDVDASGSVGINELILGVNNALDDSCRNLRRLAGRNGISVGAAVRPDLFDRLHYTSVLAREFNLTTPENAMKADEYQLAPGEFNLPPIIEYINLSVLRNMTMIGSPLVWHDALAPWMIQQRNESPDPSLTVNAIMQQRIAGVMRPPTETGELSLCSYISDWIVVNEPFEENGSYRQSFWYEALGPDYIKIALQVAHVMCPEARLFINDFSNEEANAKSDALYELARNLLDEGYPIHGVGFQMHLAVGNNHDFADMAQNFQRFADLGLEIQITELDVRICQSLTDEVLEEQGRIYRESFSLCLNNAQCTAVTLWGISDAYSWIPTAFEGCGAALLFDNEFNPKPAYFAVQELLETRAKQ